MRGVKRALRLSLPTVQPWRMDKGQGRENGVAHQPPNHVGGTRRPEEESSLESRNSENPAMLK